MKYYILAGIVAIAGLGAVLLCTGDKAQVAQADEYANKRTIVEAETKVRPAHFADMKWNAEAELRAPASKKK